MAADHPMRTHPDPWPAIRSETREWVAPAAYQATTRREREALGQHAYQAAVLPEIADLEPPLSRDTVAEAEDAVAEMARFDAEMGREVLPYRAVLLRGEAITSSDIEHITSGARSLFEAEETGDTAGNAGLVAANVRAMTRALDPATASDLDTTGVLAMHAELLAHDPHHEAGQLRTEQVWIGGWSSTPVGAHYVPPHHERAGAGLVDALAFARRSDLPRIPQLAITHAQFESIHPFTDGNGRTGRALMHVMMRDSGLVQHGLVPVSAGLLTDTASYHRALDAYREGSIEPIVSLLTLSSLKAVNNARRLVETLRDVRESWSERVKSRRGSATWRAADLLLERPLLDARRLESVAGVPAGVAARTMQPLVDAGVVRSRIHFTSRRRLYWAPEVMTAVDDFAERAGRRTL